MLGKIVRMVGGDPHQKILEALSEEVDQINALEEQFERYSDQELKDITNQFRLRLAKGESLDDILAADSMARAYAEQLIECS